MTTPLAASVPPQCCFCSCSHADCYSSLFDCLDPGSSNGFYECQEPPPATLPCSAEVQQSWVVAESAEALALAAAVNCSGGSFEVEWRGSIVVESPVYVRDGTVLTVTGVGSTAVIDGNAATRLFTVVDASLHLRNVNISYGASSAVGGGIAAAGSRVTLNHTSFVGNRATGHGGAVYVSNGSTLSCLGDIAFDDNNATGDGGAMYVIGASAVDCGASWLGNVAGDSGGAIYAGNGSSVSWTDDAVFVESGAGRYGGAICVLDGSTVSWDGRTEFHSNRGALWGGAVVVEHGSSLSWGRDTTFTNNSAIYGGALMVVDLSAASWNAPTTFLENQAWYSGGAAYVQTASSISWTGHAESVFDGNQALIGGGIAVTQSSELSCAEETTTTYVGNSATISGGALEVGSGCNASFGGNASFEGNSAVGDPGILESGFGGALLIVGRELPAGVFFGGSTAFVGNFAEKVGGGLVASYATAAWGGDTAFVGNSAGRSGGAVFVVNGSSVAWTGDTTFTSNEASTDGGAVASPILDSVYNLRSSTLLINGPTAFVNNTCGGSGGGLAAFDGLSVDVDTADVTFSGNAAEVAGGAVFVSGAGVGFVFVDVSFVANSAQVGGAVSIVGSGSLKGFFDLEWPSPTTFDRCSFVGNQASATGGAVESAAGQDAFVGNVFVGNKAGTGGALRMAGTASVENCSFVDNVSDDGEGAALSNIGFISKMAHIYFSENVFDCPSGTFLDFNASGDPFEAVCAGCDIVCDGCVFEQGLVGPSCSEAMAHSTSAGGNTTLQEVSIDRGYWRATSVSEEVLECFQADACLGGVTGTSGYCLEGYEGPYCSICSGGYTKQLGFSCTKCSENKAGGIVVIVMVAILTILAAVAVVSYVMSRDDDGGAEGGFVERVAGHIPLQSVKIVIVSWQILTQFTSVANVTYPDVYQDFLDAMDVFNFDLSWVFSTGCIFDIDFHDRLLVSTISPLVALSFLACTNAAVARTNRGSPRNLQNNVWQKHVSMGLLLTFLVYSNVSSVLFQSFACEELHDGKNYLRSDYRIECDSSGHKAFQAYAGFMIVLYPVGIPALYAGLLFRDRDVLRKDEANREDPPRVTSTSHLWEPYKPSAFYYEVIECCRRVLLAGVAVFIYPNTAAQIAVTLVIAVAFTILSEALDPYSSRWDSWTSRMGHVVVLVSMYVALLLKVDVSDERASSQRVFEAILVAVHACMVTLVVIETIILSVSLRAAKEREAPLPRLSSSGKSLSRMLSTMHMSEGEEEARDDTVDEAILQSVTVTRTLRRTI
ncbi:unnamed protein product [Ectocarpus sp. CCAP 1310/34]|nr:unnamed protein product [Ectocarpus sp. CCAP 1310/34]